MGALGEEILREHPSPGVGLGLQPKENVVVLPILPWIPAGKGWGGCRAFLPGQERDSGVCCQVHRCVPGQVCGGFIVWPHGASCSD